MGSHENSIPFTNEIARRLTAGAAAVAGIAGLAVSAHRAGAGEETIIVSKSDKTALLEAECISPTAAGFSGEASQINEGHEHKVTVSGLDRSTTEKITKNGPFSLVVDGFQAQKGTAEFRWTTTAVPLGLGSEIVVDFAPCNEVEPTTTTTIPIEPPVLAPPISIPRSHTPPSRLGPTPTTTIAPQPPVMTLPGTR